MRRYRFIICGGSRANESWHTHASSFRVGLTRFLEESKLGMGHLTPLNRKNQKMLNLAVEDAGVVHKWIKGRWITGAPGSMSRYSIAEERWLTPEEAVVTIGPGLLQSSLFSEYDWMPEKDLKEHIRQVRQDWETQRAEEAEEDRMGEVTF